MVVVVVVTTHIVFTGVLRVLYLENELVSCLCGVEVCFDILQLLGQIARLVLQPLARCTASANEQSELEFEFEFDGGGGSIAG